jgi:hypothetical protein
MMQAQQHACVVVRVGCSLLLGKVGRARVSKGILESKRKVVFRVLHLKDGD